MATYKLNHWSLTDNSSDPYQAPELNCKRLQGKRSSVMGGEEHGVITSPIDKVEGRKITTVSGSIYMLGDIDPEYLRWMRDNGMTYDPENPIKDRRHAAHAH